MAAVLGNCLKIYLLKGFPKDFVPAGKSVSLLQSQKPNTLFEWK
jgi:hypothetical protein